MKFENTTRFNDRARTRKNRPALTLLSRTSYNLFLNNENDDGVSTWIQPSMSTIPFTSAFFTQFTRFVLECFFSLSYYTVFFRLSFRPSASVRVSVALFLSLSLTLPPPCHSSVDYWNYTGPSEFALLKWAAAATVAAATAIEAAGRRWFNNHIIYFIIIIIIYSYCYLLSLRRRLYFVVIIII